MEEKRGSFGSRLGFILVSAGCAIGIGNVWKFPYVTGENGGAVFVLFYLLFLVVMGLPVVTMELAVGRASGKTILQGYKKLEKPGSKWHIHGWFAMAGCYILMMYYTTVAGWMVNYFFKFASGQFEGVKTDAVGDVFEKMLANPIEMGLFMAITVILGFCVLSLGVEKGLERVTSVMMLGLLFLIIILAVHSLTLPGAAKGVSFYLLPDWKKATDVGLWKVISSAMNQAFFTLSIGIGSLEIFGSYMSKDHALTGESIRICALDTFVALISGLIIFPACFSYNVEPSQGPSLIFVTLPRIFINMQWGRLWGTMFFVFMTFASFSTVTAVFENLIAILSDNWGWSRKKSIIVNAIFILVASLPCVLGYNVWSNVHLIGARDVLDSEDFIVSNLLLPIGSLIFLLFCVTKAGWGFDKYMEETNTGAGMKMPGIFKNYFRFVLPVLIMIIILQGLI
ncbi:neurotransmitter:Na+ symporter, NSS family [Pseudobutyrivibrio sp. YE44]|uniref:sodium-dependent transporter n=1 Tax=Pseudobutyrivibrio sp. YE44 TaxID=1520802 RepID=UPI000881E309|nr:sodium-dependent transporter [Pseudobutyrivibrio sp. YE44]SDB40840.1 neurotransmitter:Na+ symporter, NSS family [Pseudobutyrivibrio sp. YE44]